MTPDQARQILDDVRDGCSGAAGSRAGAHLPVDNPGVSAGQGAAA